MKCGIVKIKTGWTSYFVFDMIKDKGLLTFLMGNVIYYKSGYDLIVTLYSVPLLISLVYCTI